jgi:predicted phage terminase large subunit-like protein
VAQHGKWGAHSVLIEDTAAGQSLIQELRRNTRVPIIPVKADRDKVSRASAITAAHEAGLVYLPDGEHWLADFVDEMSSFPNAPHDDQVDAFVHAMQWAITSYRAPEVEYEPEEEYGGYHSGTSWMV